MTRFARTLQLRLQHLDLSPRWLAHEIEMNEDHVKKIYSGQIVPNHQVAGFIAARVGLDVGELQAQAELDRFDVGSTGQ